MEKPTKELIEAVISDLAAKFLYYDRREDEQLSVEGLEWAVTNNVITVAEMVEAFSKPLCADFGQWGAPISVNHAHLLYEALRSTLITCGVLQENCDPDGPQLLCAAECYCNKETQ